MRFEHQIAITSETAVGKSSLFKSLKDKLEDNRYRWVSVGELMRERAKSLGMTVEEFAEHNWQYPQQGHDRAVDHTVSQLAKSDWMVCEGRLPHHFMPHAFKVLLVCPPIVRAMRRHQDYRHINTLPGIKRAIEDRDRNDRERYQVLYPGCIWKPKQFHLVLSTDEENGDGTPEVLAGKLLEKHKLWVSNRVATPV